MSGNSARQNARRKRKSVDRSQLAALQSVVGDACVRYGIAFAQTTEGVFSLNALTETGSAASLDILDADVHHDSSRGRNHETGSRASRLEAMHTNNSYGQPGHSADFGM